MRRFRNCWRTRAAGILFAAALVGVFSTGCRDESPVRVERVNVVRGAESCARPGEMFPGPLVIELQGPQERGLLGGSGSRRPAAGVKLLAVPEQDSDLVLEKSEFESDAGGTIRIPVRAGKQVGDQYLRLIPVGAEERAVTVRFISGVSVRGNRQEGAAGAMLPEPVSVQLYGTDGRPAAGRRVFFDLVRQPAADGSAQLTSPVAETDENGVASTGVMLNGGTGSYRIDVKPADTDGGLLSRGISVEVLGMNFWMLMLNAFAGLAIFVWGMQMMSDGLQKVAGERMKSILRFFSRNRVVALLAGAGVTAVIQSSSASTVMVIGFINAGLLNLSQAIGIIFGTNIGTTVTAQIVSFDVGALAMPAIIAGLLLYFITWRGIRGIGETVLGFGFLFFGMSIMSEELTSIGSFPSVIRLFERFDCTPVDGVMPFGAVLGALLIGLVVTMIIQSSSASTGIIIALGAGGLINLYTAMPLVLGANIGTTVTAQLAAIPANRVAKQAALAHTLFNVFGTTVMVIFFYVPLGESGIPAFFQLVDWITPGDAFAAVAQNMPRHIANAHTLFNVLTALILLPFVTQMAHLCEKLIPVRKKKVKYTKLDPYLLENPPVALQQALFQLRTMTRGAWNLVSKTMADGIFEGRIDTARREEWTRREHKVDKMQEEITAYLTALMQHTLSSQEAQALPVLLHCTNDAERLADYASGVINQADRLAGFHEKFGRKPEKELRQFFASIEAMAQDVLAALDEISPERADSARHRAEEIRRQAAKLEDSHLEHLSKGDCTAETGVIFIALVGVLRQVTDRLDNIAARTALLLNFDIGLKKNR